MSNKDWHLENYKKKFSARSTQRILPSVEAALAKEQAVRESNRDTVHHHPSELSKTHWCPRASWLKIKGEPESRSQYMDLRRMNILAEGNNIHDKWQRLMWKAGGLYGNWSCSNCYYTWEALAPENCPECSQLDLKYKEVPIYNEEYRVIGHADGVWQDSEGRAVVEIKSVGLGTLRWEAPSLYEGYESGDLKLDDLWDRLKRPLLAHRKQVNLYMYFLGIDKAIVIYEWKPSQEVKEFHLSLSMDLVSPILEGINSVNDFLDKNVMPDRPTEATHQKSTFCRFCAYKESCWKM